MKEKSRKPKDLTIDEQITVFAEIIAEELYDQMKHTKIHMIELEVVNSPTVLQRIIQLIKSKRINICRFSAAEDQIENKNGIVRITMETDDDKLRLLKSQFEKQIDVIKVK